MRLESTRKGGIILRLSKDERGLTLVEVIASIVLITIILLSFFSFFINSAKHTKFNEEKLSSIEIAENIIGDIRSNPASYSTNVTNKKVEDTKVPSDYKAYITIVNGPNTLLKKAKIEVKPATGTEIKKSPFTTYIYYEVHDEE